jgi:hypothetical protein
MIGFAGHIVSMEDDNIHNVFIGKPEGNRPLRIPTHKLNDNIKMNLKSV